MSWKTDVIILAFNLHCALIWLQDETVTASQLGLSSGGCDLLGGRGQLLLPARREQKTINVAQLHLGLLKIIVYNHRSVWVSGWPCSSVEPK